MSSAGVEMTWNKIIDLPEIAHEELQQVVERLKTKQNSTNSNIDFVSYVQ